ncbi:MAG: hypothetical protein ACPG1A_04605 [Halioglobus sp.]|jgi:hypothetical protein
MIEIRTGNMGNDLDIFHNGRRIARTDVFRRRRAFYIVDDSSENNGVAIDAKDATPRKLQREPYFVLSLLWACGVEMPAGTEVAFIG